jgi:hypothetical protein
MNEIKPMPSTKVTTPPPGTENKALPKVEDVQAEVFLTDR